VKFRGWFAASILLAGVLPATAIGQGPPVPRPFPGSSSAPPPAAQAAPPAPGPAAQTPIPRPALPTAQSGAPAEAMLGVPGMIGPGLEFLESFDAGKGQRCYLYGTQATFLETITYYKQLLKDGGRELFKSPAMQQFDLGKFQEQTMAYPPSVVVKDYAFGGSEGYLHVVGTKAQRYKTIVQIVPGTVR
jgi:hypothetical protein